MFRNVQFPRAIREEGVTYLVDQVVPSSDGSFYRVQGTIRRLLLPGESVSKSSARKSSSAGKAAKVPATAADLPTCTEIGTGVLVQCVPEGKKLRARVVSDGYNPDWNIRFHGVFPQARTISGTCVTGRFLKRPAAKNSVGHLHRSDGYRKDIPTRNVDLLR